MTPCTILFLFLGGFMEEYDMLEIWKEKLRELRYQRKLMSMDKKFSEEELKDMDEMIRQVEKEYAKELIEKEKEDNKNKER
jgi:hypothetical protein